MRFTVVASRPNRQNSSWGIVDAITCTNEKIMVKSSYWPLPSFGCVFSGMQFDGIGCIEHNAQYGTQFVASSLTCLNTEYAATVSAFLSDFGTPAPKWVVRILEHCGLNLYKMVDAVCNQEAPGQHLGFALPRQNEELRELLQMFRKTKFTIQLCAEYPELPVKAALKLSGIDKAQVDANPWVIARTHKIDQQNMLHIADKIGDKLHLPKNDANRIEAYVRAAYVELSEYTSVNNGEINAHQGSTWFTRDVFSSHLLKILPDDSAASGRVIESCFQVDPPSYLRCDQTDRSQTVFTLDHVCDTEARLAHKLMRPRNETDASALAVLDTFDRLVARDADTDPQLDAYPRWRSVFSLYRKLDPVQRNCLRVMLNRRMLILVGGAGTGKTLTLACCVHFLVDILHQETRGVALMGKAATRLQESLADECISCCTIHAEIANCCREPCNYAVDEIGTCPTHLLLKLIDTVTLDKYILFSGDEKQLPSIQAGMVLRDMLQVDSALPVVRLQTVHRTAEGNDIASISPTIFESGAKQLLPESRTGDFSITLLGRGDAMREERFKEAVATFQKYQSNQNGDVQMLTNTNATAEQANCILQPLFLPEVLHNATPRLPRKYGAPFLVGDRVVCTETIDTPQGVRIYNGTIGSVHSINITKKNMVVHFHENAATYTAATNGVKHAYCLTIHRSQGSEYAYAVVLLQSPWALSKNLLYTAITRAQRAGTIVASEYCLQRALSTEIDRTTRLSARLQEEMAKTTKKKRKH